MDEFARNFHALSRFQGNQTAPKLPGLQIPSVGGAAKLCLRARHFLLDHFLRGGTDGARLVTKSDD